MLSVVIPAFNEAENIEAAAMETGACLARAGIDYELIFVDDGSKDGSYARIEALHRADPRVRGLRFSRNLGKESAIFAGLAAAKGDCCAVMDADLQHPPETLPAMYALWQKGAEVVEGVKSDRGRESAANGFFARLFYKLMCRFTGFDMEAASDFKLLDRRVVDILLTLPEKSTFFRGLTYWVGFETATVPYEVAPRLHGRSKWSFTGLVRYAFSNIANFSSAPLGIIGIIGAAMTLLAVVLGVQTLVRYLCGAALEGFTTVILLQLLTTGCVLISLSLIGYYMAKVYDEVKARPRYIVARTTEDGAEK